VASQWPALSIWIRSGVGREDKDGLGNVSLVHATTRPVKLSSVKTAYLSTVGPEVGAQRTIPTIRGAERATPKKGAQRNEFVETERPELSSGKRESPSGPSGCRSRSVICITSLCGELWLIPF